MPDPEETNESDLGPAGGEMPEEQEMADSPDSSELNEIRRKTEELDQVVAQLKDQLLRKAAEFDNYKKRTESEIASIVRFANEDLLLKILPVVDDLERFFRSLKSTEQTPGGEPKEAAIGGGSFLSGVELIHGKFKKILEQVGLKPFESVGKPFDPELHDALLQVPRGDIPEHTVVEEIEKGYQLNEKVIRHARVIVSAAPAGGDK